VGFFCLFSVQYYEVNIANETTRKEMHLISIRIVKFLDLELHRHKSSGERIGSES
jgi:hypothetical protein